MLQVEYYRPYCRIRQAFRSNGGNNAHGVENLVAIAEIDVGMDRGEKLVHSNATTIFDTGEGDFLPPQSRAIQEQIRILSENIRNRVS